MLVAPQAHCDDGRLDVVVVGGLSKAQLLVKLFADLPRHPSEGWQRCGPFAAA